MKWPIEKTDDSLPWNLQIREQQFIVREERCNLELLQAFISSIAKVFLRSAKMVRNGLCSFNSAEETAAVICFITEISQGIIEPENIGVDFLGIWSNSLNFQMEKETQLWEAVKIRSYKSKIWNPGLQSHTPCSVYIYCPLPSFMPCPCDTCNEIGSIRAHLSSREVGGVRAPPQSMVW